MKLDKDIVKNKKKYPAAQTNVVHKRVTSDKTWTKLVQGYSNLGITYRGHYTP